MIMRIIKFYAKWCGPCKKIDDVLNQLPYDIEYVDTDVNKKTADKHHIKWLPTVVVFDDKDNEITRFDDEFTKDDFMNAIQNV